MLLYSFYFWDPVHNSERYHQLLGCRTYHQTNFRIPINFALSCIPWKSFDFTSEWLPSHHQPGLSSDQTPMLRIYENLKEPEIFWWATIGAWHLPPPSHCSLLNAPQAMFLLSTDPLLARSFTNWWTTGDISTHGKLPLIIETKQSLYIPPSIDRFKCEEHRH